MRRFGEYSFIALASGWPYVITASEAAPHGPCEIRGGQRVPGALALRCVQPAATQARSSAGAGASQSSAPSAPLERRVVRATRSSTTVPSRSANSSRAVPACARRRARAALRERTRSRPAARSSRARPARPGSARASAASARYASSLTRARHGAAHVRTCAYRQPSPSGRSGCGLEHVVAGAQREALVERGRAPGRRPRRSRNGPKSGAAVAAGAHRARAGSARAGSRCRHDGGFRSRALRERARGAPSAARSAGAGRSRTWSAAKRDRDARRP